VYDGTLRYLWRYRGGGTFLRTIAVDTQNTVTTNLSGRIDTRDDALQVQFTQRAIIPSMRRCATISTAW
jgi:hypothetical protein